MATVIVGLLVLVALFFAIKGVLKHWRGDSRCWGGGEITAPPKKKLTGQIIGHKTADIEGMTCGNCKIRVEQLLDEIDGAVATVNLHRNTADIAMTREVSDEEIFKALAGSDYKITAIHHD